MLIAIYNILTNNFGILQFISKQATPTKPKLQK